MKAEEVFNIAVHLSDKELEKLYCLLHNKVENRPNKSQRPIRKKLISEEEAREFILKTVFKIKT